MQTRIQSGVPRIHAIQTGSVQVKRAQVESRGKGLARAAHILFDSDWSEWLPIFAWAIEHEEGVTVVDTGETVRVNAPGYFPGWHPYFKAVHFRIEPEDEIGPQLKRLGIQPADVRQVVLTHLHTDHAGGLARFEKSKIWTSRPDFETASGRLGPLQGYLKRNWPGWWKPEFIQFRAEPCGPFAQSMPLTKRGDVVAIPTPGHTPAHVSVVVHGSPSWFLAGDTSYNEELLRARKADGVSPNVAVTLETGARILELARQEPMIYLPSHDPENLSRIARGALLC
jgi:glyoxylase-like metal-dependent hydrolase (beta-lactamase superfamily II)